MGIVVIGASVMICIGMISLVLLVYNLHFLVTHKKEFNRKIIWYTLAV